MCLVFDGLLQSIYFRMFCSKHSITFDTYLLSCRFHCVDIFYINFRFCETFTVTHSGAIFLLIQTPFNFKSFQRITERLPINFFKKNKVSTSSFQFSWIAIQCWISSSLSFDQLPWSIRTNKDIESAYVLKLSKPITSSARYQNMRFLRADRLYFDDVFFCAMVHLVNLDVRNLEI